MNRWPLSAALWLATASLLAQTPPRDPDPVLVARSLPLAPRGKVASIVVEDGLAVCALVPSGLAVVDVQDPVRPRRRSGIVEVLPAYAPRPLAMKGRRVFAVGVFGEDVLAAGAAAELGVFDLQNPERPVRVGSLPLAERPIRLQVTRSVGLLAFDRRVEVLDLGDDRNPNAISRYEVPGGVVDVSADGSTACVIERREPDRLELHFVTFRDPARPQRLGGFITEAGNWYSEKVVLRGNRVFLARTRSDHRDALMILDISNPREPVRVGTLNGDDVQYLVVSGDRVLMGDWNGIQTVSLADETRPTVLGWFETGNLSFMVAAESTVYVGREGAIAELQLLDLSDPSSPRKLGSLPTGGRAMDLALVGRHALLAEGASGLQILEVSDPSHTRRLGEHSVPGEAVAAEARDGVAAVLAWDRSEARDRVVLELLDVRALPEAPRLGSYVSDRFASYAAPRLALSGPLAYLAGDDGRSGMGTWMEIVDCTRPDLPRRLGVYTWTGAGAAHAMVVGANRLALALDERVEVLDVSSPTNPRWVASLNVGGVKGMAFVGPHLLLSGRDVGTRMIDLTDPANPVVLGTCPVGGSLVRVAGSRVFAAEGVYLHALDLSDPASPREIATAISGRPIGAGAALDENRVLAIENEWLPFEVAATSGVGLWSFSRWANPQRAWQLPTRGAASAVVVSGASAWFTTTWRDAEEPADRGSLERLDLSDPTRPGRAESFDLGTPAYGVTAAGDRVYVAAGASGLQVFDGAVSGKLRRLGGFHNWEATGVAVAGSHAYVADGENGLQVVDVSDPAEPRRVSAYRTEHGASAVVVSGHHAYVARSWYDKAGLTYRGGFDVLDIADPPNPRLVGSHDSRRSTIGIAVSGGHAYLSKTGWDGQAVSGSLEVVDVADPSKPVAVAQAHTARSEVFGVAVQNGYAYVTSQWWNSAGTGTYRGGLEVFDVADPANPRRMGAGVTDQPARGVAVSGRYAYVATQGHSGPESRQTGLEVFEISDPLNVRRVGGFAGHAIDVAVVGAYACVVGANRLDVLDMSDPANPRHVGGYATTAAWGAVVDGQRVYVADGPAGLQIIDLTEPTQLRRVGGFVAWDARAVAVQGDLAYIADDAAGLRVVDVSDSSDLRLVGEHLAGGRAMDVVVQGRTAYLACGEAGLQIVDISEPVAPRELGSYTPQGWVSSVTLGGALAYLTGNWWHPPRGWAGLEIVDVTNPSNPRRLGGHPTTTPANHVRLAGRYAYAACDATLEVFDASDPTRLRRVGGNSTAGSQGVVIWGDHVLVAGERGMAALDRFVPLGLEVGFRQSTDGARLAVNGPSGWPVRIQRSADLRTWREWRTAELGDAAVDLADLEAASQPWTFYRAVAP